MKSRKFLIGTRHEQELYVIEYSLQYDIITGWPIKYKPLYPSYQLINRSKAYQ